MSKQLDNRSFVKNQLAKIINDEIQLKGWSQRQACIALDMYQPRLSRVVNNHLNEISCDYLLSKIDILGVEVELTDIASKIKRNDE